MFCLIYVCLPSRLVPAVVRLFAFVLRVWFIVNTVVRAFVLVMLRVVIAFY